MTMYSSLRVIIGSPPMSFGSRNEDSDLFKIIFVISSEKIEGRGAHLADMTEKLLNVESHVHDLTRFVSDVCSSSRKDPVLD